MSVWQMLYNWSYSGQLWVEKSQSPKQALVRTAQKEVKWKKLVKHFPTVPNSFISNVECALPVTLDGAGGDEVASKLQHIHSSFHAHSSCTGENKRWVPSTFTGEKKKRRKELGLITEFCLVRLPAVSHCKNIQLIVSREDVTSGAAVMFHEASKIKSHEAV